MLPEKNALSLEEIDEQSALELPERELLTTFSTVISPVTISQTGTVVQVNTAQLSFAQSNAASLSQFALVY
jgi:hypothetical protein